MYKFIDNDCILSSHSQNSNKEKINNIDSNNEPRSKISLKRVSELHDKEPDTILLSLVDKTFGFDEYMKASTMGENLIRNFLVVLNKAFECHSMEGNKLKVIEGLAASNFFNELVYRSLEKKDQNGTYDMQLIKNVIKTCSAVLQLNPARYVDLEKVIERLELLVRIRIRDRDLCNEFDEKIDKIRIGIEEQKKKSFANNSPSSNNATVNIFQPSSELLEPPNKIENIPILPTLDEITTNNKPYLRKNIINGAFKNVEHYLDIHFRLLREDFLQPLRKGITEFKALIDDQKRKTPNFQAEKIVQSAELLRKIAHIEGLRAYFNVSFISNMCSDQGITLCLQLDVNKCKDVKWEYSKRLLFGSLICLSNDFFKQNFIMAVICDRDVDNLKKGIIKIRLEQEYGINYDEEFLVNDKIKYTMFETTAYFEAYRHVLHALKSQKEDDFPFKSQIIECKNEINPNPPQYLVHSYIDLRTLVDTKAIAVSNSQGDFVSYHFNPLYDYAKSCTINNEGRWPSPRQMNLDDSQYQAIKLALNQQIALIQGYVFVVNI